MPKTKRYFVEASDGGWRVTSPKGKTLRRFITKRQAIEAGAARASAAEGHLVIRRPDGSIESERTYIRGDRNRAG